MDTMKRLTVKQLKDELRTRGAALKGNKADLVERFGRFLTKIPCSSDDNFKELNANTVLPRLPRITRLHINRFLLKYNKKVDIAESMYYGSFLGNVCYFKDKVHYFKGLVHAQRHENFSYNVYLKVSLDAKIVGSHCECAALARGTAHCKHVTVVLLGIEQLVREGKIITRQTCTQTFHQPYKSEGSVLKAGDLRFNKRTISIQYDPRPMRYRHLNVKDRLRNLLASYSSSMPFKHLFPPANPYGVQLDHDYLQEDTINKFLKSIYLKDVSDEDIGRIELVTRGQSSNPQWHLHMRMRINANHFKDCCNVQSEEDGKALAQRLVNLRNVQSNATRHAVNNESIAVGKFIEHFGEYLSAEKSGLVISKPRPYLGASPNRRMAEFTLLDVRCPYSSRDRVIGPITVPYLCHLEDGQLALKEDHAYMYEIQGQLEVTGREFCDLIVYTYCDLKVISISKNTEFINKMLVKLDDFYENYFLAALLEKHYYRNYCDYSF